MSNENLPEDTTPLPFVLSSTITVTFTSAQLVEIALESLANAGHDLDADSIKSTFTKGNLTLTAETKVGAPPPKKRVTRKKTAKKASKKVAPPAEPEEKPEEAKSSNVFQPTTPKDVDEDVISNVKAQEGIPEKAAFSVDTIEVDKSDDDIPSADSGVFDFGDL